MQCAQQSILFFQSGSKIKVPGPRPGTLILDLRLRQRPDHWVYSRIGKTSKGRIRRHIWAWHVVDEQPVRAKDHFSMYFLWWQLADV